MNTVILESPYAGNIKENVKFAHYCIKDCLKRGEAPFASHIMYTKALDDLVDEEREFGIQAGFEWRKKADYTVVYLNKGVSKGMMYGIRDALDMGQEIKYRILK